MALQITGKIHQIGMTQIIPSKSGGQPFQKREVVLDCTRFDPYTGQRDQYENYPSFEFSGEKCKDLDGYQPGQVVTISFDLQGNFFDAQDGTKKNFTRVRGYKIEARTAVHPQPQKAVQPQAAPAQPQGYQQASYPQTPPPPPGDGLPR